MAAVRLSKEAYKLLADFKDKKGVSIGFLASKIIIENIDKYTK